MSYTIEFKPEVYDDIKVAYDWYEEQRVGLGEDFLRLITRELLLYQLCIQSVILLIGRNERNIKRNK